MRFIRRPKEIYYEVRPASYRTDFNYYKGAKLAYLNNNVEEILKKYLNTCLPKHTTYGFLKDITKKFWGVNRYQLNLSPEYWVEIHDGNQIHRATFRIKAIN
jgi:hypothetical protein